MSDNGQRQLELEEVPDGAITDEELQEELDGKGIEVIDLDRDRVKPTTWHVPG